MNNSILLLAKIGNYRPRAAKSFRHFHSVQMLAQQPLPASYGNPNVDCSLFFTNFPNKRREKKPKTKLSHALTGKLVINCKNKEFNHYSGVQYGKMDVIPLASKGWNHRKSRGDYFTILPTEKYSPFLTTEELPETFEKCKIRQPLIDQLKKINVTHPTAIQAKVLEKLLSGENAFIFAECGSGKTLAYVIAMIENILKWKDKVPVRINEPLGIIVVNSRELALQVMQLTSSLCCDLGLDCQALVNGHINETLENPQMRPVDILVCTVTALNANLRHNIYSTRFCKHVVLDDADTFEITRNFEEIQKFFKLSKLTFNGLNAVNVNETTAQICFVSAVAPSTLKGKLSDLLELNEVPTISTPYLHKILYTVPQRFLRVTNGNLSEELLKIGKRSMKEKTPTIVFSNRNKTCNWSALLLREHGVECVTMNKTDRPSARLENFRNFELGFVNVLCATNILSLGYHFPNVKHVVSLEFPRYMTDYIHRCGRVGRLGQVENSLITNFIRRSEDVALVQKIEKAVRTDSVLPSIYCPASH